MEDLGSPCPDVAMEDPESALLQAAMDAPFTASLGPMGPLLQQLHSRPKGVGDDKIQLLKDDLVGLCISLKKVSEAAGASFMAKWWMKEVRELCYDTQDYLDEAFLKHSGAGARRSARLISFRVGGKLEWRPQIGKKGQGRCGASRLQQTSTTRRNLKRRPQKAAISFSELMARVEVLGDVGERFELGVEAIKSDSAQVGVSRLTPHRSLRHRLHSDSGGLSLVGVEEPVNKLVNMLALDDDSQKQVKVVSIFGFAGVGKTTAATTLYRNFRGKFQCRAFVRVSRTPDMMGILTSILSQIKASQVHGFPDAQDLIDNIREHLQGKRYFIIIDDLWTTSVWNIISRAFPDSDCCSRIVTTSETEDISLACCSYNLTYMFHMCPLNDGQSRKLFFTRVFGSESGCPPEFREVSYGIITKCGGSPFTTVIVASMLASEPNLAMEQWKSIHDSLSSIVGTNPTSEGTKEVLNLIYNYLPPHLKTCLLHLGVYPEGYTIRKHDLVKQWVAEGFLGTMEEVQNMEKIAGVYFDELVSRGMVQAVDTNYGGEVLSCTIHQMVLDFIRDKSMEENFAITVDYFQSTLALPDKVRRLSIQFGGAKSAKIPEGFIISHVRSLLFFGFFKCVPLTLGYGLLRVLILHMWANEDKIIDLSRISELSRLTYLKIKCNSTIELPAKIGGIQDLGTLEVDARLSAVPSDIVHLENLLHLRLPSESCMPREVGHMTCLRTLGYFDIGRNSEENVMNLGKLTNLQDLQLTCSTVQTAQNLEKNLHLLGSILEKLSILQSVTLVPTADSNANTLKDHAGTSSMSIFCDSLSSVSFAPSLERIELLPRFCIFPTLPKWFEQLGKLRTLKIAVRELCGEDICILKALPALTALSLYVQTAPAEIITFDKTGFLLLSYLKFRCTTPSLKFESDAMPNLLKLKLSFMAPYRVEQYATATISIEHLSCLKEISTKIRGAGAISIEHLPSGKQISTQMRSEGSAPEWATIINHKNNPTINVQLVGCFFNGNPGMETQGKDEVEHEKEEPKPNDMRTLTQPLSSSDLLTPDFNIQKLELEVKVRWLKPREVLNILQKHQLFTVERRTPQKPPSGSWFLFNRRVHRFFRNDGYEWRKKKNGKTIAEAHEYLKVDNLEALNCYYAHEEKNPTFQRRIYWMLEPAYEHIVLVHYRDVLEGSISLSPPNNSSTSNHGASRADAHSSPGLTSGITVPLLNSCSPGSAEEVSSQILTIRNETNNASQFDWMRTIELQLSLENKEDRDVNAEEILPNHNPITVPGIQTEDSDNCTILADILTDLESSEDNHNEGSQPYTNAIDVLKNSDIWLEEDQLESFFHSVPLIVNDQLSNIHEVSPERAFCSESAKVVIVGDFLCNPSRSSWVLFGDVKVPVEIVQQGVIRCHTPYLGAGKVRLCVLDENEKPCTEAREFEFVEKPTSTMISGNEKPCSEAREFEFQRSPTKSGEELLLLLNYVQILFDGRGCELFSEFRLPLSNVQCGFQTNPSEIISEPCEQLDHENAVNCIMEVMLNNKFQDWLSSKFEQNSEGKHLLPKQYHGVIHTIAALGYDSALKSLLSSGVPINYRDANGWTALHWAARFGREKMVGVLLTAGAAAGALSNPTSEDPAAKTPASIAFAYGFKGLSAFLSEAELIATLHSLESKDNGNPVDHTGAVVICSAVDRISDKCAHVDGGTDDQLALKDSLGAVRNAVQAAGRIQATFRVFSLKKKKEKALQNGDSCTMPIREAGASSRAMLEKAALSIQKNFRCWKKRKEFLRIRKNIIKIQARVRAHQERNKYKELLQSVGILEKVMLRWFRKGVGLRGFNTRAMPIDQDEEEDIVRVFRKERVETAVNEAVSRVSAIVGCPVARIEYRRMLEIHQQAKSMAMESGTSASS